MGKKLNDLVEPHRPQLEKEDARGNILFNRVVVMSIPWLGAYYAGFPLLVAGPGSTRSKTLWTLGGLGGLGVITYLSSKWGDKKLAQHAAINQRVRELNARQPPISRTPIQHTEPPQALKELQLLDPSFCPVAVAGLSWTAYAYAKKVDARFLSTLGLTRGSVVLSALTLTAVSVGYAVYSELQIRTCMKLVEERARALGRMEMSSTSAGDGDWSSGA